MAAPPRSVPKPTHVEVNGWKIFAHPLFDAEFELLVKEVERLRAADPVGYVEKKTTKLLAAIFKMAFEIIPRDPTDPMFRQGKTLGAANRHWHRGKFFQNRYRLFFRYSTSHKVIILAWINDEETLRTYGSKTDAYAVFEKMLAKNRPPSDWTTLFDEAKAAQLNSPLARAFANLGKQKKQKKPKLALLKRSPHQDHSARTTGETGREGAQKRSPFSSFLLLKPTGGASEHPPKIPLGVRASRVERIQRKPEP